YGVAVVVGEKTVAVCPDLAVLELDFIQVKGRPKPTRVFMLAALLECGANVIGELRPLHGAFLQAYRAQRWDEAAALIAKCRSLGVEVLGTYYDVLSARIASLRSTPPSPDWNGAYVMMEK